MNVAVDPFKLIEAAPEQRRVRRVGGLTLGMPQLCFDGLSETWLLKHLGDLHWSMLAELAGRSVPDFRDASGERVYAAFCAVRAEGLKLDRFEEHDELVVASEIAQVSRTRFASAHDIGRGGARLGRIELLSTFVRRGAGGGNRSIARVSLPDFAGRDFSGAEWEVAGLPARFRAGGSLQAAGEEFGRRRFAPCPGQDFNGAKLLYFASYQAFADRAEWELLGAEASDLPVRVREIAFHGNLEPGERIDVILRDLRRGNGRMEHRMSILAARDGRPLADLVTMRSSD